MDNFREAVIIIEGVQLSVGESMTLRCALAGWDPDCGDDPHGRAMTAAYKRHLSAILELIHERDTSNTGGGQMIETRRDLQRALMEWRDAGGPVEVVTDYIEGMISAKVHEILQARSDNETGEKP